MAFCIKANGQISIYPMCAQPVDAFISLTVHAGANLKNHFIRT